MYSSVHLVFDHVQCTLYIVHCTGDILKIWNTFIDGRYLEYVNVFFYEAQFFFPS